MTHHLSIPPFETDTLARTRVTTPDRSPAVQAGNAALHVLWHGWRTGRHAVLELTLARRVARERRALGRLVDHELRDIGLDRQAARREAGRKFLDLPATRRR